MDDIISLKSSFRITGTTASDIAKIVNAFGDNLVSISHSAYAASVYEVIYVNHREKQIIRAEVDTLGSIRTLREEIVHED